MVILFLRADDVEVVKTSPPLIHNLFSSLQNFLSFSYPFSHGCLRFVSFLEQGSLRFHFRHPSLLPPHNTNDDDDPHSVNTEYFVIAFASYRYTVHRIERTPDIFTVSGYVSKFSLSLGTDKLL